MVGTAMLPFTAGVISNLASSAAWAQDAEGTPFSSATVRETARRLAAEPFKAPDQSLPDNLTGLSYDLYRDMRYLRDRALWRGENLPFEVQFFHRGFIYNVPVEIFTVQNGRAQPFAYSRDLFNFGTRLTPPEPDANLGFSGFRLHGPLNRPDYFDEVAVFQGASYFRGLAKGQVYGISARGLAIKTAEGSGEEFPFFRSFWLERPQPGTGSIVVHALLDSESATAAYRFTIRPGDTTIFDVEMAIYPRVEIPQAGLAPLTSMFYFDANDRVGIDDFRPGVHDSDGLAMWSGRGERLWRPLSNPQNLEISVFNDVNPRGFGLMQRQIKFEDYYDLEARYDKRPSLWVEPIGDWGEGAVHLIEIPTKQEIHDNIVAFWRPRDPLRPGAEYIYTYRLHWCWPQAVQGTLARFEETRLGRSLNNNRLLFVMDVMGEGLKDIPLDDQVRAEITTSRGKIHHPVIQPNPETGGWRLNFEVDPEDANVMELRAQLKRADQNISEAWIYRWTV
jgi:periplasmic glucans biosynthesis protein